MNKNKRLAKSPLDKLIAEQEKEGSMSTKRQNVKTGKQHVGKPIKQQPSIAETKPKKVTYYVPSNLVKKLKMLAVEKDKDYSSLVTEAIKDLLGKYE